MNEEKRNEEDKKFDRFGAGIYVIKAENSNFNADFSGIPRMLPDENSTIYATDKALKYAIRKYWHDMLSPSKNNNVLFWRRYTITKKNNKNPKNGEESNPNQESKTQSEKSEIKPFNFDNDIKELEFLELSKGSSKNVIVKSVFEKCLDVRLFGGTFTLKKSKGSDNNNNGTSDADKNNKNFSITGPIQITYGVNKYAKNIIFQSSILGPKPSDERDNQFTMGSEYKAREVHYVYDYVINPNNIEKDEFLNKIKENDHEFKPIITQKDIDLFKEAIRLGVNYLTSASKIGSESELFIYFEYKKDGERVALVPMLKNDIKIEDDSSDLNKKKIDLSRIVENINQYSDNIEKMEIYYNPVLTKIEGCDKSQFKEKIKYYNIITKKSIVENK